MNNIGIIIPAAGKSSRFGQNKQLLNWDGDTMLNHCIKKALKLSALVCVVLRPDQIDIERSIKYDNVMLLKNLSSENGLGETISSGTKHLIHHAKFLDGIMILLSDMPLLSNDYLLRFLNIYHDDDAHEVIATMYSKGMLGVPAIFRPTTFKKLVKLSGDKGAQNVIYGTNALGVIVNSETELLDIDQLKDYELLQSILKEKD